MSVVQFPDPLAGLCAYMRAQPALASLLDPIPQNTGGLPAGVPAIFRPDIPQAMDGSMPMACIMIRPYGGYTTLGDQRFYMKDPLIDLIAFASQQNQATAICRAAGTVLAQLASPQVWENCLLYSCQLKAGPVPLPDEQTLWPACWLSVTLVHGELPAG